MITTDTLERARRYALKAHDGQKYGDEFPYFVHIWAAYGVALRFGIKDETVLAAILLHDVLEDTDREYEEMVSFFGEEVARIVSLVTEPKGMTRKERHALTYPKLAKDPLARIVKLCDRISHVEFGGKKVQMYRKEHSAFKAYLGEPASAIERTMWVYLDNMLAEV
jgi:(p)ppGpp synthase/HD superfamily hydrolase